MTERKYKSYTLWVRFRHFDSEAGFYTYWNNWEKRYTVKEEVWYCSPIELLRNYANKLYGKINPYIQKKILPEGKTPK